MESIDISDYVTDDLVDPESILLDEVTEHPLARLAKTVNRIKEGLTGIDSLILTSAYVQLKKFYHELIDHQQRKELMQGNAMQKIDKTFMLVGYEVSQKNENEYGPLGVMYARSSAEVRKALSEGEFKGPVIVYRFKIKNQFEDKGRGIVVNLPEYYKENKNPDYYDHQSKTAIMPSIEIKVKRKLILT